MMDAMGTTLSSLLLLLIIAAALPRACMGIADIDVTVSSSPPFPMVNTPAIITITVRDGLGQPVPSKDLLRYHDKKMHVVILGADLEVLGHIHPEDYQTSEDAALTGAYNLEFIFPRAGMYMLVVELAVHGNQQSTDPVFVERHLYLEVAGNPAMLVNPEGPELNPDATKVFTGIPIEPGSQAVRLPFVTSNTEKTLEAARRDFGYRVTFSANAGAEVYVGDCAELSFTVEDNQREVPVTALEPYLGAMGHLAVVHKSFDNSSAAVKHAHAMDHAAMPHGKNAGAKAGAGAVGGAGQFRTGSPMGRAGDMCHAQFGHMLGHHAPEKFGPGLKAYVRMDLPGVHAVFLQFRHGEHVVTARFRLEVLEYEVVMEPRGAPPSPLVPVTLNFQVADGRGAPVPWDSFLQPAPAKAMAAAPADGADGEPPADGGAQSRSVQEAGRLHVAVVSSDGEFVGTLLPDDFGEIAEGLSARGRYSVDAIFPAPASYQLMFRFSVLRDGGLPPVDVVKHFTLDVVGGAQHRGRKDRAGRGAAAARAGAPALQELKLVAELATPSWATESDVVLGFPELPEDGQASAVLPLPQLLATPLNSVGEVQYKAFLTPNRGSPIYAGKCVPLEASFFAALPKAATAGAAAAGAAAAGGAAAGAAAAGAAGDVLGEVGAPEFRKITKLHTHRGAAAVVTVVRTVGSVNSAGTSVSKAGAPVLPEHIIQQVHAFPSTDEGAVAAAAGLAEGAEGYLERHEMCEPHHSRASSAPTGAFGPSVVAHVRFLEPGQYTVFFQTGHATSVVTSRFVVRVCPDLPVMRWTDPCTWRSKPAEGSKVHVPRGAHIILDESPPCLDELVIDGTLEVSREAPEVTLCAARVVVRKGGKLVAGSEAAPLTTKFTVELINATGRPVEDFCRSVVQHDRLLASTGGTVEIYGIKPNPPWSHLAAASRLEGKGTVLGMAEPVAWLHGDKVVLSASGGDPAQVEVGTVASVDDNGRTVTLFEALVHSHAAEVAVLSRNVKIVGKATAQEGGGGGSVLVTDRALAGGDSFYDDLGAGWMGAEAASHGHAAHAMDMKAVGPAAGAEVAPRAASSVAAAVTMKKEAGGAPHTARERSNVKEEAGGAPHAARERSHASRGTRALLSTLGADAGPGGAGPVRKLLHSNPAAFFEPSRNDILTAGDGEAPGYVARIPPSKLALVGVELVGMGLGGVEDRPAVHVDVTGEEDVGELGPARVREMHEGDEPAAAERDDAQPAPRSLGYGDVWEDSSVLVDGSSLYGGPSACIGGTVGAAPMTITKNVCHLAMHHGFRLAGGWEARGDFFGGRGVDHGGVVPGLISTVEGNLVTRVISRAGPEAFARDPSLPRAAGFLFTGAELYVPGTSDAHKLVVRDNVAAGSDGDGLVWSRSRPAELSGNVAHSNALTGLVAGGGDGCEFDSASGPRAAEAGGQGVPLDHVQLGAFTGYNNGRRQACVSSGGMGVLAHGALPADSSSVAGRGGVAHLMLEEGLPDLPDHFAQVQPLLPGLWSPNRTLPATGGRKSPTGKVPGNLQYFSLDVPAGAVVVILEVARVEGPPLTEALVNTPVHGGLPCDQAEFVACEGNRDRSRKAWAGHRMKIERTSDVLQWQMPNYNQGRWVVAVSGVGATYRVRANLTMCPEGEVGFWAKRAPGVTEIPHTCVAAPLVHANAAVRGIKLGGAKGAYFAVDVPEGTGQVYLELNRTSTAGRGQLQYRMRRGTIPTVTGLDRATSDIPGPIQGGMLRLSDEAPFMHYSLAMTAVPPGRYYVTVFHSGESVDSLDAAPAATLDMRVVMDVCGGGGGGSGGGGGAGVALLADPYYFPPHHEEDVDIAMKTKPSCMACDTPVRALPPGRALSWPQVMKRSPHTGGGARMTSTGFFRFKVHRSTPSFTLRVTATCGAEQQVQGSILLRYGNLPQQIDYEDYLMWVPDYRKDFGVQGGVEGGGTANVTLDVLPYEASQSWDLYWYAAVEFMTPAPAHNFTIELTEDRAVCPGEPPCWGHGTCWAVDGKAACQCAEGWAGVDCGVPSALALTQGYQPAAAGPPEGGDKVHTALGGWQGRPTVTRKKAAGSGEDSGEESDSGAFNPHESSVHHLVAAAKSLGRADCKMDIKVTKLQEELAASQAAALALKEKLEAARYELDDANTRIVTWEQQFLVANNVSDTKQKEIRQRLDDTRVALENAQIGCREETKRLALDLSGCKVDAARQVKEVREVYADCDIGDDGTVRSKMREGECIHNDKADAALDKATKRIAELEAQVARLSGDVEEGAVEAESKGGRIEELETELLSTRNKLDRTVETAARYGLVEEVRGAGAAGTGAGGEVGGEAAGEGGASNAVGGRVDAAADRRYKAAQYAELVPGVAHGHSALVGAGTASAIIGILFIVGALISRHFGGQGADAKKA